MFMRVDLKSVTAACCVYLPVFNSLMWLSEWVSEPYTDWHSYQVTMLMEVQKDCVLCKVPAEAEETVAQWKRP